MSAALFDDAAKRLLSLLLVVMASIPCAAYQVGHLHGTLRREHHSRMLAMSMSRHGIFEEKRSMYTG